MFALLSNDRTEEQPWSCDKALVNHSASGRQPVIVLPDPVYMGFNTLVIPKNFQNGFLCCLGVERKARSLPPRPAQPGPNRLGPALARPNPRPEYILFFWNRNIKLRAARPQSNLSNPKPGDTTGEEGRGSARRGGKADRAGQDGTPTGRFAQDKTDPLAAQSIEENCPERFFGSTNKRIPM